MGNLMQRDWGHAKDYEDAMAYASTKKPRTM